MLAEAEADGVRVFRAGDHVTEAAHPATSAEEPDVPAEDDGHHHDDPHIWLDPVAMAETARALTPVLGELGVDVSDRLADLECRLAALDAEVRGILAAVPEDRRKLVTGHESMGYFADRYGFDGWSARSSRA